MKGTRAFLFGGILGGAIAIVALELEISRFSLALGTLSTLATLSVCGLALFTILGWPTRKVLAFDIYDCFRIIIGSSLSVLTVCFVFAVVEKVAETFAIDHTLATVIATTALFSYVLAVFLLIDFFQQNQKSRFSSAPRPNRK